MGAGWRALSALTIIAMWAGCQPDPDWCVETAELKHIDAERAILVVGLSRRAITGTREVPGELLDECGSGASSFSLSGSCGEERGPSTTGYVYGRAEVLQMLIEVELSSGAIEVLAADEASDPEDEAFILEAEIDEPGEARRSHLLWLTKVGGLEVWEVDREAPLRLLALEGIDLRRAYITTSAW